MAAAIQEDITKNQLGGEFQNAVAMNLGEVLVALKNQAKRDEEKGEGHTSRTPVFQKCAQYLGKFSTLGMCEQANQDKIRDLLAKPEYGLTEFEKASLVNLQPTNAEEAKILIPSLNEFRPRLVAAGIDEDPLGDDMMVPDDAALEVLLRDLDVYINGA